MDKNGKFSWKKRGKSFVYAWQGLTTLVRNEHNARIHLVVAALVLIAGMFFDITAIEWCLIVLAIGLVISAEALNSAIETLADKITEEYDPLIGRAKDFGAAAVTVMALAAAIIGLIIFLPYIFNI